MTRDTVGKPKRTAETCRCGEWIDFATDEGKRHLEAWASHPGHQLPGQAAWPPELAALFTALRPVVEWFRLETMDEEGDALVHAWDALFPRASFAMSLPSDWKDGPSRESMLVHPPGCSSHIPTRECDCMYSGRRGR